MIILENSRNAGVGLNDRHRLDWSQGHNNLGKSKTVSGTWGELRNLLTDAKVDKKFTIESYRKLRETEIKTKRKNLNGFFLGGPTSDEGSRSNSGILARTIVTLDVDEMSEAQYLDWIKHNTGDLWKWEFQAVETRSSSKSAPRLRLVFPLKDRLNVGEYNAVSRILASYLFDDEEGSMRAVDDVSFRSAQLMFLPTCSKDQELEHFFNRGKLIAGKKLLKTWSSEHGLDWRNHANLPRNPDRGSKTPTVPGTKAEDPFEKEGLIGAFCRAYPIEDCIESFIPDAYEQSGSTARFSYTQGSGSNGAVVYGNGRFLYSNHGSDPVSEMLVNSFDLVRIHRFGEMDIGAKANTLPSKLPSYIAMSELVSQDPVVKSELATDLASKFDDLEDEVDEKVEVNVESEGAPKNSWMKSLSFDRHGKIRKNRHNAATIISNDPRMSGIAKNELVGTPFAIKPLEFKRLSLSQSAIGKFGRRWTDNDTAALAWALSAPKEQMQGWGCDFTIEQIRNGLLQAAEKNAFNPVLNAIEGIVWDGESRVEEFFIKYCGTEDHPYFREAAMAWFTAAVARLYEPGCKFDYVPILEGAQKLGKSGLVEILAMGFHGLLSDKFSDTQKMVESIRGRWILEVGELSGFRLSEVEDIKKWFSAREDRIRLAYRENEEDFPRRCVFMGTGNKSEYLRDPTGNRRFWPIKVRTKIDFDGPNGLKSNVSQLWAEAICHYKGLRADNPDGEIILDLVSDEALVMAHELQEGARESGAADLIREVVEEWVNKPCTEAMACGRDDAGFDPSPGEDFYVRNAVSVGLVIKELDDEPIVRANQRNTRLIAEALENLEGFEKVGNVHLQQLRGGRSRRGNYYCRSGDKYVDWVTADSVTQVGPHQLQRKELPHAA